MQHQLLGCDVKKCEYDFDRKHGVLTMMGKGCCNMKPCIELFQSIAYEVRVIETFNDDGPDTTYAKEPDGKWVAMDKFDRKNPKGGFYR